MCWNLTVNFEIWRHPDPPCPHDAEVSIGKMEISMPSRTSIRCYKVSLNLEAQLRARDESQQMSACREKLSSGFFLSTRTKRVDLTFIDPVERPSLSKRTKPRWRVEPEVRLQQVQLSFDVRRSTVLDPKGRSPRHKTIWTQHDSALHKNTVAAMGAKPQIGLEIQ